MERHINVILFIHKDNLKSSDGNALEVTEQKNLQIVCCLKNIRIFFLKKSVLLKKIFKTRINFCIREQIVHF